MTVTEIQHVAHDPKGCEIRIAGIPGAIPRARVLELIESLGIDPKETLSLQFKPHAIHAEVYALKDGKRYWDGGADERLATHRIAIPIVDEPFSSAYVGRAIVDAVKAYENRGKGDAGPEPQPA